ncbi:hypothetical protein [Butyrivibrio sp. AE2032]|uniref:hypothetical protein n=1 Tax=Butyrivibrio sp. AE2032 TaxID=1458463 RepID=UPI00055567E6|nr:hypothetical protein [Butyrivibrio sp. AE2032]
MKTKLRISLNKVALIAYLYLILPVIFFFLGWLKLYFAVPLSAALVLSLFFSAKQNKSKDDFIEIPIGQLALMLVISLAWVYMSGIGGFVWQRPDWQARNAVLHDLINYPWPVVYETGGGLSYYLCYWMIPALVGKLAGWNAANMALFAWSELGVLLVQLLLVGHFKVRCGDLKTTLIPLVFILWGGLNVVGQLLVFLKGKGTMDLNSIYGWSQFQYTPNNALLEWVFNQAVPSWIVAGLFLYERKMNESSARNNIGEGVSGKLLHGDLNWCDKKFGHENIGNYVLLLMLLIPYSPFAALGFVPLLLADAVKRRFKGFFSTSNIFAVLAILPIFFAYYTCNGALSGASLISLYLLDGKTLPYTLAVLVIFYILEVGIYAVLIWHGNRRDYMFLTIIIWLVFIPLIKIGPTRDFMLRGSIIPLFMLMTYVLETLLDGPERSFVAGHRCNTARFIYAALVIATLIGMYSGVGDFILTARNSADSNIRNVADNLGTMNTTDNQEWIEYTAGSTYVSENADDTLFFGKLAKQP